MAAGTVLTFAAAGCLTKIKWTRRTINSVLCTATTKERS